VNETGGQSTANVTDIVNFSPPSTTDSGVVQVSTDSSINNESLASYLSDLIASADKYSKDFRVINANTIGTLSGNPAYSLLTSYMDTGIVYETLEIGAKIDNKVYFITYDIESSNYSNFLPYAHKIIDSFKVSASSN
jgi:hypothetical protein